MRGGRDSSGSFAILAAIRRASIAIPHVAGNRHTEEKYEHTNHSCNQKTPARVPRLRSSLGGGGGSGSGGPCAFRTVAQIERLYSGAQGVTSTLGTVLGVEGVMLGVEGVMGL